LESQHEDYRERKEDIEQLIVFAEKENDLTKFLAEASLQEGYSATRLNVGGESKIILSTIHQAKGLEWEAVFVIGLSAGQFPNDRALKEDNGLEEERRLFYVAVTRAEKYLFCSWAPIQANPQQRNVSQFHRDFTDNEHVLTRDPETELPPRISRRARQEDITLSLTFSELKYYFKCPYLFKLRFLYGFDAPINRALGYGKSLHDALAEIHAESIQGRIPSIDQVERLATKVGAQLIQLGGAHRHLHLPVVAVGTLAVAGIVAQMVAGGKMGAGEDIVHFKAS